jgi:hypothetical protein
MAKVPRVKKTQTPSSKADGELALHERNDAIKATLKQLFQEADNVSLPVAFYCECSDQRCTGRIELTIPIYEDIHRSPRRLMCLPHHDRPAKERVVEERETYWIVERGSPDNQDETSG